MQATTIKEKLLVKTLTREHERAGLWLEEDEGSGELILRRKREGKALAIFTWRTPIQDIRIVADKFS
uniref:Uncharacterized protein n=1 Tax=viral metagenome TaxID=1070528 RepID=A0A6M3K0W5_9ZZZZ